MMLSQKEAITVEPENDSPVQEFWTRIKENKLALVGVCLLISITITTFIVPLFISTEPHSQNLILGATPPGPKHWFGTDTLGRDLFTRVMEGGRISIMIGLSATIVAMTIGLAWGAISGYAGGMTDVIMMRIVDILYSLPFVIFVILLMTILERSIFILFIAIGFVEWLTLARITRSQIQQLKTMPYVDAARTIGVGHFAIIFKHLIPNVASTAIVYATLTIPSVMLLESSLSFLGLGVQPPCSSWGSLISDGAEKITTYPWLLIFPSIFFSLTLISLNFMGDGLRDTLDPKSKN